MAASRLAGACVWCSPSAHWLEETLSAPPRSGDSTRGDEGSAHVLSQKHVRNGDWRPGRVQDGGVVVVDVVVVAVVVVVGGVKS